jgi:hypothetical protein
MKANSFLGVLILLLMQVNCAKNSSHVLGTEAFENQAGVVRIHVCTRGCYQYVLETEKDGKVFKLSSATLAEAFKKDNLSVIFSGRTTGDSVEIMKPAPDDIPIFDFYASEIVLTDIRATR